LLGRELWDATWAELITGPAPAQTFDELVRKYSEDHRAYHTLRHLDECFSHFFAVRPQCVYPAEIELAVWFHDARSTTREALKTRN